LLIADFAQGAVFPGGSPADPVKSHYMLPSAFGADTFDLHFVVVGYLFEFTAFDVVERRQPATVEILFGLFKRHFYDLRILVLQRGF
jgi:hypothetical protein